MNKSELSYKLKYILNELGMNKSEFLLECRKYNPSISKPTILNVINGKNKTLPTIETLNAIINVCKYSGNEKLKNISFDFLLNDQIQQVEAKNIQIYEEIGLGDDVINRLKQYNHPIYFNYGNIINYLLIHIPANYYKYLEFLKITIDIKNELSNKNKKTNIKKILKLLDNNWYLLYIKINFENVYKIYLSIKKDKKVVENEKLIGLLNVVSSHFKYLLLEINRKLYDNMEKD